MYIDSCKSWGYKFSNIKYVIISTISCMCNITYENYMNQPMKAIELKSNMVIAKNPTINKSVRPK